MSTRLWPTFRPAFVRRISYFRQLGNHEVRRTFTYKLSLDGAKSAMAASASLCSSGVKERASGLDRPKAWAASRRMS